jgi:transposase
MAKYEEPFKLEVVRQYLAGKGGAKLLARRYGVSDGQLRRWVEAYRQHGAGGLRRKGASYDASFKLLVLKRMWAEQWSLGQTAAAFDIRHPSHIGKWERQYHEAGPQALRRKPRGRPKKMTAPEPPKSTAMPREDTRSREELLEEVKYLRAEVAYLKKLNALVQAKKLTAPKKRG